MHELSIAQSIVELAEEQARNHQAKRIEEVELEIGVMSGVELHALDFALESCIKGTMLESAKIIRHIIKGEGRCGDCENIFPLDRLFTPCPACGSCAINILKGKELKIKSILVS